MPILHALITGVTERPVGRPHGWHGTAYDVVAGPVLASTLSPWTAALCQRAQETHNWVELTWRDVRFGRDLVHVRLLTEKDAGRTMPHHHRCCICQHLVPCPGTWERNPDGEPEVICDRYHTRGRRVWCERCAEQADAEWQAEQEADRAVS